MDGKRYDDLETPRKRKGRKESCGDWLEGDHEYVTVNDDEVVHDDHVESRETAANCKCFQLNHDEDDPSDRLLARSSILPQTFVHRKVQVAYLLNLISLQTDTGWSLYQSSTIGKDSLNTSF